MTEAQDQVLEIDPVMLAGESSDYESSGYNTSTASLTSSINEYVFENGRRYHSYFGTDKNPLPTDDIEQDRLDLHHEIFLLTLDGNLHKSPIQSPHRILDVGTGTGIWAIDMADTYPSATVFGTDISPIQPKWVPPNCKFEVDDAEMPWTYRQDFFDFIHLRNLAQGISDWPKLMRQAYRCTAPGGYVELAESGSAAHCDDGSMSDDNPLKYYCNHLCNALEKMGRPPAQGSRMVKYLEDAGFVDIKLSTYKQALGPWPRDARQKQIGAMMLLGGDSAFHAYGMMVFTRILGFDSQKADQICREAHAAMRNKKNHIYLEYYVAHGCKPK